MISIFALKENILEAFCIINEAIQCAVFPDKEISEKIRVKKEKHKINFGKVGFWLSENFKRKYFITHRIANLRIFQKILTTYQKMRLLNFMRIFSKKG